MQELIEGIKRWSEQEIAHKLWLNGEAVGMRKTKSGRGTAKTHESDLARNAKNVKQTLQPTPDTNYNGRNLANFEKS